MEVMLTQCSGWVIYCSVLHYFMGESVPKADKTGVLEDKIINEVIFILSR